MEEQDEELTVVTSYIMYYDLLEGTRYDGSFFSKIDRAILLAREFIRCYPIDYIWGIEKEFDETLEEWVKNNYEVVLK